MSTADLLLNLNEVSKAGNIVNVSNVIEFLTDSGKSLGNCVKQVIRGVNGTAQTVYTHVAESASGLATSGLSFLTMDVGLLGAAIAPVLGVAGGLAISEIISPGTAENVIEAFRDYGLTVGNEVVAYYDVSSGQVAVPEEVINIYKEALISEGYFDVNLNIAENVSNLSTTLPAVSKQIFSNPIEIANAAANRAVSLTIEKFGNIVDMECLQLAHSGFREIVNSVVNDGLASVIKAEVQILKDSNEEVGVSVSAGFYRANAYPTTMVTQSSPHLFDMNDIAVKVFQNRSNSLYDTSDTQSVWSIPRNYHQYAYATKWKNSSSVSKKKEDISNTYYGVNSIGDYYNTETGASRVVSICSSWICGLCNLSSNAMEGAVLPVKDTPISTTFTGYNPLGLEDWVTDVPALYPIPVVQNPAMTQAQAWNPAYDDSLVDALAEAIVDAVDIPAVITDVIVPPVVVDPDVPAVDDPIDLPIEGTVPLNPADPNLPSQKVPVPMLPVTPFTTESNAMFTVYNPTASQLNELGAFLWSNDTLDQIVRIWTNPMDGIISLRKVYATPTCDVYSPIQLGNLTTDIVSKVVSNQFSTINCGTVKIPEIRKNATDYPPYTKVSIYLPFIGIMDLDTAEVMNSEITLYYHIDMYTGTCLAEIYVKRPDDFVEPQVLYTFTGNCSQTLPLTSQEASGLIGTLTSIATAGMMASVAPSMVPLSVAGVANAMSHGQTSVLHSGALSSNAGIMGQRKPYVIVSRQQSYDANSYSELYGFPSNATVYLGNCSGYQKIKAIRLQSEATEEEKLEIENLLYQGVIV